MRCDVMAMEPDPRATLLANLRGKTLHIPPLRPLFTPAWQTSLEAINPLHEQLKTFMGEKLATLIEDKRVLEGMKKGDAGLWVSGLFPTANFQTLSLFATYTIFLFLWDDAIDGSDSSLTPTLENAEKYCANSVGFIRYCLLGSSGSVDESEPVAPTKVCQLFGEVAAGLKAGYLNDGGKNEFVELNVLYEHLKQYVDACLVEYRWRTRIESDEMMPTIKEFWGWRLGTSSVNVMLDFERVLNGVVLSSGLREDAELGEQIKGMEGDVNRGFVVINELFSLKKELKDGALGNLIPITMHELGLDLDGATKKVVQELGECLRDFDEKAGVLQMRADKNSDEMVQMARKLVEGYRAIITGTLNFSIHSPRYGVLKDQKEDASFEIEL
ncbi:isoprenoid synthase domain-containing protein [Cladorrhinum sp. PSN332]|nr:isoprenoid synthase domain-containing protein [Cladorrhinum sp. PSN332]